MVVIALLAQQFQDTISLFMPFVLVIAIFYLLIIRPMQKRKKAHDSLIASMSNGDKVITNGGIYGTVSGIRDNTFILKVAEPKDGAVKIEISKNAIASLQEAPGN
jgi:preprotein translocase subunit YajC